MAQAFEALLTHWLQGRRQSPEQAAPDLGVGHVAVYAWLNGEYQPSNTKIPALARALALPEERVRAAIEVSRRRRKPKSAKKSR